MTQNKLGKITEAHFRLGHDGASAGWLDTKSWVTDPKRAGYGAIGDLGIHGIDLLTWLLGAQIVSGSVVLGNTLNLDCEDHGAAIVTFESGAIGVINTSWIDAVPGFQLSIKGLRGTAELDVDKHLIVRTKVEASQSQSEDFSRSEDLGVVQLDAAHGILPFLEYLRTKNNSSRLVSIQDALRANETIDMLYKSVRESN